MTPHVQVAILGGGPGGAALALTLVRENISVLLIEGTDYETLRVGELLSPEGVRILRLLLPHECEDYLLASLGVASAWDTTELIRQPYAQPWRALDRTGLDKALAYRAKDEGAELLVHSKLSYPKRNSDGSWALEVVHPEGVSPYRADLLIDATGRGSRLAKHFGAVRRKADNQTAIVAFLDTSQGPRPSCDMLLETTDEGWWYAAPITDTSAVAVFVTDLGMVKGDSELAWRQALQKTVHIRQRYAHFPLSEKTRRVAAENSIIFPSCGENWLAIGDAASCHDPFSSKGIGRVLAESTQMGSKIIEALQAGRAFSPFLAAETRGKDYNETLNMLKSAFRQVRQWPLSQFWLRRLKVRSVEGEDRERRQSPETQEPKFFFAKDQLFECSRCGECCNSEWSPEVEQEQVRALRKSFIELKVAGGRSPVRLTDDGTLRLRKKDTGGCVFLTQERLCSLHPDQGGGPRPLGCDIFPFTLRETPDGIQVGVSFLCRSVKRNEGLPLGHYEQALRTALGRSKPTLISKSIPVSYGRVFEWEEYCVLESVLLSEEGRSSIAMLRRLRHVRWVICRWAGVAGQAKPVAWDFQEDSQSPTYAHLDHIFAINMIMQFAREQNEDSERLEELERLLEEAACYLVSPQVFPEMEMVAWVDEDIERYLRAVVERKFLLTRLPLLHNLCLLCVVGTLLKLWTYAFAHRRGDRLPQRKDYESALNTVELRLVTFKNRQLFAHQITAVFLTQTASDVLLKSEP